MGHRHLTHEKSPRSHPRRVRAAVRCLAPFRHVPSTFFTYTPYLLCTLVLRVGVEGAGPSLNYRGEGRGSPLPLAPCAIHPHSDSLRKAPPPLRPHATHVAQK